MVSPSEPQIIKDLSRNVRRIYKPDRPTVKKRGRRHFFRTKTHGSNVLPGGRKVPWIIRRRAHYL
jgi:hypothetical protein